MTYIVIREALIIASFLNKGEAWEYLSIKLANASDEEASKWSVSRKDSLGIPNI